MPEISRSFIPRHNLNTNISILNDFINFNSFHLYNNVTNFQGTILDLVECSEETLCNVTHAISPFIHDDRYHPSLKMILEFVENLSEYDVKGTSEPKYNLKQANFKSKMLIGLRYII